MAKTGFDPKRNPFEDMREAFEQAKRERKNVLVDVGGDWCVWCHRLEAFIEDHAELRELRERHFVTVKVFMGKGDDTTNIEFLNRLPPIDGVPHLFVYNAHSYLLCSQPTAPLEEGESYNFERVRAFLQGWSDWRKTPFDRLTTKELSLRYGRIISNDDQITPSA